MTAYAATGDDLANLRIALIAASSRAAAEAWAESAGVEPTCTFTGPELMRSGRDARRDLAAFKVDAVVVHSADWSRQVYPQLYDLVLLIAPVSRRYRVDDSGAAVQRVRRRALMGSLARLPADVVAGVATLLRPVGAPTGSAPLPPSEKPWVLAIWRGSPDAQVGGSVTHISGVLSGFKHAGYAIGLVTAGRVPVQVAAVADEVVVAAPASRASRVGADLERVATNRQLLTAARSLADKVRPAFVYQRHEFMLDTGLTLSREIDRPFVLEWNSSEIWARVNWRSVGPIDRMFKRLVMRRAVQLETSLARGASIVAAVSSVAAEMARAAGASADRVIVVPNGVDTDEIRAATPNGCNHPHQYLGWIGSFGPWHGADVAVSALTHLPANVRLIMIGDGVERLPTMELATSLGVADRVQWTGRLDHSDAISRLAACDVLICPHVDLKGQRFFGSPTKVFEYLALGKPIVASRLEQLDEVLDDGGTAILVEPGDARSLAEGVSRILGSPELALSLGAAARAEAVSHHTWRVRADTILDCLGGPTVLKQHESATKGSGRDVRDHGRL